MARPTVLRDGLLKRIHVNGALVRFNKRSGENLPVFTVKTYDANTTGREVRIDGPCILQQNFEHRLASGAVAWIETRARVTVTP